MPFETRRIMFNYDEVHSAIITYGQKYNMNFPEGKLTKVTDANPKEYAFNPMKKFRDGEHEKSLPLIFSFFMSETGDHKYINLNKDFVQGALVDYCIEHKIMLPKDHYKSIDVIEFHVALDLTDQKPSEAKTSLSLSFDE